MAKKLLKPTSAPQITHSEETESTDAPTPTGATNATTPNPRVYKGTRTVDHDLFKLEVAKMAKNVSFTDIPQVEFFEHCHIFHTVDSSGRKQDASNAVGGHHHDITVSMSESGVPELKVSQPRKWVKKKIKGRFQRLSVPIRLDNEEGGEVDTHTHAVRYMGSERIQLRDTNVEFAKFESAIRSKQEIEVEGAYERQ